MRLHTNLTRQGVLYATRHLLVVVCMDGIGGSKQRRVGMNVALVGTGYARNTGRYGAGDEPGATWDEWGAVIGSIYLHDPDAVWGGTAKQPVYADAEHFHFLTNDRFRDGEIPDDTHRRHNWQMQDDLSWACKRCAARRPSWSQNETWLSGHIDTRSVA